jgi:hydroxymethylbilane synthase
MACVLAERALLLALGGTCHSPIAALARMEGGDILLRAEILREDGSEHAAGEARFAAVDAGGPARLARSLLERASPDLRALFAS